VKTHRNIKKFGEISRLFVTAVPTLVSVMKEGFSRMKPTCLFVVILYAVVFSAAFVVAT
jgi:hypothetical protein